MSRGRAAAAALLLGLLAWGDDGGVRAADEKMSAPFLVKARAAHARGDHRAVERLVAADRWVAYDAFYETLKQDDETAAGGLAEVLATAYTRAFEDSVLEDALRLARSWTPDQRAHRREAFALRVAARVSAQEGRLDAAAEAYGRILQTYVDLGDVREQAWSLSNLGGIAVMQGQSREGLEYLDRAVELALQVRDRSPIGGAAANRAYGLDDLGETEAALAAYDHALTISRQTGDLQTEMRALASRGSLLTREGRPDDATADFLAAAAVAERAQDFEVQSVAWLNLATLDQYRGDTETQVRHLKRSVEAGRRGGLPLLESDANLILGRIARYQGNHVEARRRLEASRAALAGSDDVLRLTDLDLEEASLRMDQGRDREALELLTASERRLEGLELGGSRAAILVARAVALYHLGDYDGAIGTLRASVDEAKAKDHPALEGMARAHLGYLLFTLGDAAGGIAQLEEAMRLDERLGDRPGRGLHLEAIGFIRYRTGDLAGARQALEEALTLLPPEVDPDGRAETMKSLGLVLLATGGSRSSVDGAETRRRGADLLRQARETFTRLRNDKAAFQANLLEADALLGARDAVSARAALLRAERIPSGRAAREDLWLADHLRGRLAELERDPAMARRRYQRAVAAVENLRGTVRPAPWRAALLEDRIAPYRALVRLLREEGDEAAAWKVARAAKARTFVESLLLPDMPPTLSVAFSRETGPPEGFAPSGFEAASDGRLAALLAPDERLIDFFADGREVIAFVLGGSRLVARTLRVDAAADMALARWPGRPGQADAAVTAAWRRVMGRIGTALFEPLAADLDGAKRLLIVPGGPLHGVPFAAVGYRGRRLVDQFEISVLPAAEALLSRHRHPAGTGALVIGDPASGEPRLPAAAREAQAVGALAGGSRVLTGAAATEAAFRRLAPASDWIHVAAHGRIDPIAPARTQLALAAGADADGRLEAGEVAAMDLTASLVVLTGCGTGVEAGLARGDAPADERAGLPRAFLQAGAGTVVAALWEMDDDASAAFIPRLYQGLRSREPASALAGLQRDLASGRIRGDDGAPLDHPYYWAGLLSWGAGLAPTSRTAAR